MPSSTTTKRLTDAQRTDIYIRMSLLKADGRIKHGELKKVCRVTKGALAKIWKRACETREDKQFVTVDCDFPICLVPLSQEALSAAALKMSAENSWMPLRETITHGPEKSNFREEDVSGPTIHPDDGPVAGVFYKNPADMPHSQVYELTVHLGEGYCDWKEKTLCSQFVK
ncbi:hypothetical protein H310_13636 [Aphanomyces invadans]|uniref:Uncharacterized protein n=1 Tax=Aphanomyces invadans TaxID=157072 RepID=A0A024TDX8_9STRA|nr:hypothetical protein H310_13636 [Aphanomyces invadans]ETV91791.1 hypothetical protein H310_13636 [Aphanomyces invadans]|eukprot:XP_008879428.1 hypothetical protein H310_13636 [Aphanomyces invadans]